MKLYILRRKDPVGYDEFDSMIVSAISPKEARIIAGASCGDEGNVWINKSKVTCTPLKPGRRSMLILGSFNAG